MYKWKFKIPVGFKPSSNFTHIHQVKAVGGDEADPLFTLTPRKGSPNKMELIHNNTTRVANVNLSLFEGVWVECTEVIHIDSLHGTYSMSIKKVNDGSTVLSYSNNNIMTIRYNNTFIRPKWGIYRSKLDSTSLRDDTIRFSSFYIAENSTTILPNAPTSLSVNIVSATQVDLSWTDNSANEEYFRIERSTDGSTWSLLATVDPNSTGYSNTGINSSTPYYYRVHSENTFGNSAYSDVVQTLPVELVSFTATSNQLSAELHWSTATEINNFGFEIERTTKNNDQLTMSDWSKVGFVKGSGSINTPKEYTYSDKNVSAGNYSYRLKQIDRDGKFAYSQSVEVVVGQVPKLFSLSDNYPNPFNPSTMIEFTLPTTGRTTMKVFSVLGQEMTTLVDKELSSGTIHRYELNAEQFPSGIYFYQLVQGNQRIVKRMMLLK
jgi:hypothetical protein